MNFIYSSKRGVRRKLEAKNWPAAIEIATEHLRADYPNSNAVEQAHTFGDGLLVLAATNATGSMLGHSTLRVGP